MLTQAGLYVVLDLPRQGKKIDVQAVQSQVESVHSVFLKCFRLQTIFGKLLMDQV